MLYHQQSESHPGSSGKSSFPKWLDVNEAGDVFRNFPFFQNLNKFFTDKKRHDFLFRSTNLFSPKKSLQNNDPFQHAAGYERLYYDFCSLLFLRVGSVDLWKVSPRATSPVFAPARRKSRSWTDRRRPSLPSLCHLSAIPLPSLHSLPSVSFLAKKQPSRINVTSKTLLFKEKALQF